MNPIIELFKSFFMNLWVEHILYAHFIDKSVRITIEELEEFCMLNDWDAELSLDWILRDDSNDTEGIIARLKDSIRDSDCGCALCRRYESDLSRI